jgi:hypothetical protein
MALGDVLATKLCALGELSLDYRRLLGIARSLREQINWHELRERTLPPYAAAFFTLVRELGIAPELSDPERHPHPRVRVLQHTENG